jgi:HK97 gp10 family phage protein
MADVTLTRAQFKERWPLVMEGIANDFVNALKNRVPVNEGHLKASIRYKVVSSKVIEINMLQYGMYVEFGTAPHIIRPKDADALKFSGSDGPVFAKVVNHPGTRPQPFIRTTLKADMPKIIRENLVRHLS